MLYPTFPPWPPQPQPFFDHPNVVSDSVSCTSNTMCITDSLTWSMDIHQEQVAIIIIIMLVSSGTSFISEHLVVTLGHLANFNRSSISGNHRNRLA